MSRASIGALAAGREWQQDRPRGSHGAPGTDIAGPVERTLHDPDVGSQEDPGHAAAIDKAAATFILRIACRASPEPWHTFRNEWWRIRDLYLCNGWTRTYLNDYVNNPAL